ncbi:MAG: 3-hydroxyacyl-CoA dehydrogenase / enoyl-CoA hydratase / 3-hydroxybutyryl-CoA epimerase [Verrucomicrobiota bacterium]|jgi:3-hydroxyacyl-CoA dehydrogenase/enoyl-CoA hydratase/3-hydroxybutyryl-CoA epimerase
MTERIRRHVTEENICVLTFDRPDSAANIFDRGTLEELNRHLDVIAASPNLKGLILTSAKPSIFIAGADIGSFSQAARPEALADLIQLGQNIFNRISALSIPSVAAIHGACVGGGYEICLACDARIASPDKSTKIGLPETMLGILPGWGGSTRLPRLIGVPKALDIILAGKTLAAKPALKCGMIDEIVPREYLVPTAARMILFRGLGLRRRRSSFFQSLTKLGFVARLIAWKAEKQLFKKTRGHYPAPVKALEVVTRGISRSVEDSLAMERDAIVELGRTEIARNLIRIFFLQERARKLTGVAGDDKIKVPKVRQVAVIGAGVMGAGIAQWASSRDLQVILRDINQEAVAKGLAGIGKLYDAGVKRHALTKTEARAGMDRIAPSAVDVPLTTTDIVIEAAVERMDLKRQLFARLDELAGPNSILATNTSALSVSEIASATRHPERVIGIHFFNPVHKMQLVEIVVGQQTSPEVVRRAVKFVQQIGKLPVVCKDSPGFLVNRILMPYLIEAGHLFECGARIEDIDECMLDFGMPMGPLRLIDEVGLDVASHVATDLSNKFSDRMQAPTVLTAMIADKLLGKKNGRGFYIHAKGASEPDVNPDIDKYHHDTGCAKLSRDELRTRMVLLMVNESARCLEEEIVAEPADVDFGMIMGTGFAPFLGGPLRFADFAGIHQLVDEMKKLAGKGEVRFTPCKLLQTMAGTGRKFYEA